MTKVILTNQLLEEVMKELNKRVPTEPHLYRAGKSFSIGGLKELRKYKFGKTETRMYQMARARILDYVRIVLQEAHDKEEK